MHFDKLIVREELNLMGRGPVLVIDLVDNGFAQTRCIPREENPFTLGDTLDHNGKKYSITGIESTRAASHMMSIVGLLIKEHE